MELTQAISIISALGFGSILGVLVQIISGRRLSDKKMLFDARTRAYSGITGRVFNLFLEPDITSLKEDALIWAKLNQLLSETMLMASHNLAELLGEYKIKVFEFHKLLEKKTDEEKTSKIHKELILLAGKIHVQMRKDLHVDRRSVFDEV